LPQVKKQTDEAEIKPEDALAESLGSWDPGRDAVR